MTDRTLLVAVELELLAATALAAPELLDADSETATGLVRHVPVARDGWGHAYIPATSLAGSLRAHLAARPATADLVETLMGGAPGELRTGDEAVPSAVRLLGTRVRPADGATTPLVTTRTRTAVDRTRAAAAEHLLRTHEVLEAGTRITAWLRLDLDTPQVRTAEADLREALLAALADWTPVIGGSRSTGLGRASVTALRHGVLDLSTDQGLKHWLTLGGPELVDAVARETREITPPAEAEPLLEVTWRIVDALHVGTGRTEGAVAAGEDPDGEGRTGGYALAATSGAVPHVPGSSWKGVLRSRCEFILRSVGLAGDTDAQEDGLGCDSSRPGGTCGQCVLCDAFGWSGGPTAQAADAVGARGTLVFAESPIHHARLAVHNHVSLDRVFGGASNGLLHAQQVVESGTLTLTVHTDPAPGRQPADPELVTALLHLACHDIHDGLLGVGGGVTRGQGTLAFATPDAAPDRAAAVRVLVARRARTARTVQEGAAR